MYLHQAPAIGDAQHGGVKEVPVKVQDVMTSPAYSCIPEAAVVEAARTMADHDCGALPVLDPKGRPIGMITDRDICMAVARKNRFPAEITVREVMSSHPFVCKATDEIEVALPTMAARKVRRLPVVNEEGRLVGILSVNDVAAALAGARATAHGAHDVHRMVVEALLAICAPARDPKTKSA